MSDGTNRGWVFKATSAKAGFWPTRDFARRFNFIYRTAFDAKGHKVAFVDEVAPGDTLHVYYMDTGSKAKVVGSFRVATAELRPDLFDPLENLTLVRARDPSAFAVIRAGSEGGTVSLPEAYGKPDPILDFYVGWAVELLEGVQPPPYRPELFPAFRGSIGPLNPPAPPAAP